MRFGDYHILIVPRDARKTQRFHLNSVAVRILILCAILAVPLIFGSFFSNVHYQNKVSSLRRQLNEDRALLEQKEILASKLSQLERGISRTEHSLSVLESALDLEQGRIKSGLGPLEVEIEKGDLKGRYSIKESMRKSIEDGPSVDDSLSGVLSRLHDFDSRVESIHSSMEAIYDLTEDKIRFLNATPGVLPVSGWITSDFGFRRNPYSRHYKMHYGLDIGSPIGTAVRAPADGRVLLSRYMQGYGRKIVIDHGFGVNTIYAHASKLFVNEGDLVKRGEKVASVGSSGASTGPHLHYEVHVDGIPVDPLEFIAH